MRTKTSNQSGNILFLILIAVALFAALSYAVTNSNRNGGMGEVSPEKMKMKSSQIMQYTTGMRGAITRMTTAGAIALADINFNTPSTFSTLSASEIASNVFHPQGGSYPYDDTFGTLKPTADFQLQDIGSTTAASPKSNELVLLVILPANSTELCKSINANLGYGNVIITSSVDMAGTANYADKTHKLGDQTAGVVVNTGGYEKGCYYDATLSSHVFFASIAEQ